MWPKFLNSKWFERLFTATLSIMLLLITQRFTTVRDTKIRDAAEKIRIETEINSKAPYKYVDDRNKELKSEFENENTNMRLYVDKTVTTIASDITDIRDDIHELRNFYFSKKVSRIMKGDTIKPLIPLEGYIKLRELKDSVDLLLSYKQ
jgi:hypothetical protein